FAFGSHPAFSPAPQDRRVILDENSPKWFCSKAMALAAAAHLNMIINVRHMPQRLHTFLFFAVTFVGSLPGGTLFCQMDRVYHFTGWPSSLIFIASILFCTQVPFAIFKPLVPARCPKCRSTMRVTGTRPVRYAC